MTFDESEDIFVTVSVFTTVVESVLVVVEDPDPHAAKALIPKTSSNFFICLILILMPVFEKGNPDLKIKIKWLCR
jgi:hypothetical protein